VDFYTVHTRYKIGSESRGAALSAFVLGVVEEEAGGGGGDVAGMRRPPCPAGCCARWWEARRSAGEQARARRDAVGSPPGWWVAVASCWRQEQGRCDGAASWSRLEQGRVRYDTREGKGDPVQPGAMGFVLIFWGWRRKERERKGRGESVRRER
jgi:hypothetical protein